VLDHKYAVSGAQDTSVFVEALTRALNEWTGDSSATPSHKSTR
jgi:predicted DsbA family dithiol-disulfide isomerase